MKRILTALLTMLMILFLVTSCSPKFSPVKDKDAPVSVSRRNISSTSDTTSEQKTVPLSQAHATELISYLKKLSDGDKYICNCEPDVSIMIGKQTFSYHSASGLLSEQVGGKMRHYYVGDNRLAINKILDPYIFQEEMSGIGPENMEDRPLGEGEVSARSLALIVGAPQTTALLKKEDAERIIAYVQNLPDGKDHLCDCPADVSLVIGEKFYYYHSHSGVLTEKEDNGNIYYVGDNREAINEILKQYITLVH